VAYAPSVSNALSDTIDVDVAEVEVTCYWQYSAGRKLLQAPEAALKVDYIVRVPETSSASAMSVSMALKGLAAGEDSPTSFTRSLVNQIQSDMGETLILTGITVSDVIIEAPEATKAADLAASIREEDDHTNVVIIAVISGTLFGCLGFLSLVSCLVRRRSFSPWCTWSQPETPCGQKIDDLDSVSLPPPVQTSSSISLPSLLALQQVQRTVSSLPLSAKREITNWSDVGSSSPLPPIPTSAPTSLPSLLASQRTQPAALSPPASAACKMSNWRALKEASQRQKSENKNVQSFEC